MKIIKYLWGLSFLIFLAVSLTAYAIFPEYINLPYNELEDFRMSKSNFFYASLGGLVVINLLFGLVGETIGSLPKELFIIPQKKFWLSSADRRKTMMERIKNWIRGFALIINFFLALYIGVVLSANHQDAPNVAPFVYAVPVLLLIWLFCFFFIFKHTEEA